MTTTTIRVDTATHQALLTLSESAGTTLMDTVRQAAEALRRQRFAHDVVRELDALRRDDAAWSDYISDAAATEVADGIS